MVELISSKRGPSDGMRFHFAYRKRALFSRLGWGPKLIFTHEHLGKSANNDPNLSINLFEGNTDLVLIQYGPILPIFR